MGKSILITGVSGSGKSAVCAELNKRGYKAYDIEEMHDLFNWRNKNTGDIIDDLDNQDLELVKQHDWVCNKKALEKIMSENKDTTFYCGTASNTDEIFDMFDMVFLLIADNETTRKRLSTRETNNFGRTEEVQEWVLTWKEWWENHLVKKGATVIDANRNIKEVVDEIISKIESIK